MQTITATDDMTRTQKKAIMLMNQGTFLMQHAAIINRFGDDEVLSRFRDEEGRYPDEGETTYVNYYTTYSGIQFNAYGPDARSLAGKLRRAFGGGKWEKGYIGDSVEYSRRLDDGLRIMIDIPRGLVCTPTIIEEQVYIEPVPAQEGRYETKTRIEWDCKNDTSESD